MNIVVEIYYLNHITKGLSGDTIKNKDILARAVLIMPSVPMHTSTFQIASQIPSKKMTRDFILFLKAQRIGHFSQNFISFSIKDKALSLQLLMNFGYDLELLSERLHWQDFESLTSLIIDSLGLKSLTNINFSKPRVQIDVIGIDKKAALVIDCKHWKSMSKISIERQGLKQLIRAKIFLERNKAIDRVLPIIVTLHNHYHKYERGNSTIVPITKLKSFLLDYDLNIDEGNFISRDELG